MGKAWLLNRPEYAILTIMAVSAVNTQTVRRLTVWLPSAPHCKSASQRRFCSFVSDVPTMYDVVHVGGSHVPHVANHGLASGGLGVDTVYGG